MMIVVATGSYKSTITSIEATNIIAGVIKHILPDAVVEKLALADGGEGTIDVFGVHFDSMKESRRVQDPLGKPVSADLCFLQEGIAVVESCQAIGFSLMKSDEMNPFIASSYGLGELINYAVHKGAKKLFVTMGDSATMDMGIGMLSALGVKFYTRSGSLDYPTLHDLHNIIDFDVSQIQGLRERVEFVGLVDTDDYLCGEIGQVQLYGHQKGLKDCDIPWVESAFLHFSEIIRRRLGIDVTRVIRATGSGGVGAALHAFLNAELLNTLEYLEERLRFDEIIRSADITITGEGCLDNQTKFGKVPYFVAKRSSQRCIGVVGKYTHAGLDDIRSVCNCFSAFCMNPDVALKDPRIALHDVASSVSLLLKDQR